MSKVTVQLNCYKYGPGDTIMGEARCYFRSPKEFRKIRIRLQGHEQTHWTKTESHWDSHNKRSETRTVTCEGSRDFLLKDDIVHGAGSLSHGEHVFPIHFTLPTVLPSTYSCTYGKITYAVKLTVDRAFKTDLEDTKYLEVFSPVNFANIPSHSLDPVTLSDEKTVCCWCCAGGNVDMQVTLETQGFIVGRTGNVKIYCLNMSNTNVDNITLELKQKFTYITTSSSDQTNDTELVTTSHNSGVGAHGEKTFNVALEIPSTTAIPNFSLCELFRCEYELKISAGLSGCHTDLDITTPVVVGHIPHPHYHTTNNLPQTAAPLPQYCDTEPIMSMPMPMPMPMPSISTPYPPPNSYNPSAPLTEGAPSAPPGFNMKNRSEMESPPPSYDEVAKSFPPPK